MSKSKDILPAIIAVTDNNSFLLMHDDSYTNVSHQR